MQKQGAHAEKACALLALFCKLGLDFCNYIIYNRKWKGGDYMANTGRPVGPDGRKSEVFQLRVTPAQHQALKYVAGLAGVSVGAYLIGLALGDGIGREVLRALQADEPLPSQIRLEDDG